MKGLLKYLSPFAPDQSGAVSVLFELGGITVICDAGGCTGNICGFDEPRWFMKKSALFSAGLRDMDAILGRDDRLVAKLKDAVEKLGGSFAAVIGTPVPAVIATDFRALKRMAEKRCQVPILALECTGTRMYDEGEQDTYLALFQTFADDTEIRDAKSVGVIGMTPLDVSHVYGDKVLAPNLRAEGFEQVYCYGMGSDLDAVRKAGTVAKNIVVSPAGIKAAEYLQKRFGTPYEIDYPMLRDAWLEELHGLKGKKILVLHQQVAANRIRNEIRSNSDAEVVAGTWFMQKKELTEPQDVTFEREEAFCKYVEQEQFDAIVGDRMFLRALKGWNGTFVHIPHFAVSGEYETEI